MYGFHIKQKNYEDLDKRLDVDETHFEDNFGSIDCPSLRCLNEDREHCYCGNVRSAYRKQFYKHYKKSIKNDIPDIRITTNPLLTNEFLELGNRSKMTKNDGDVVAGLKMNHFRSERESGGIGAISSIRALEDNNSAKNVRLVSVSDTVILEKRLMNFFRKIALYWFLCLNCVAKKTEDADARNFKMVSYRTDVYATNESDLHGRNAVSLSAIDDVFVNVSDFRLDATMSNRDHYLKMKIFRVMCREVFQDCDNLFDRYRYVPRPFCRPASAIASKVRSNVVITIDRDCVVNSKRTRFSNLISAAPSNELEFNPVCKQAESKAFEDSCDQETVSSLQTAGSNIVEIFSIEKKVNEATKKKLCESENVSCVRNAGIKLSNSLDDSTDTRTDELSRSSVIQPHIDEYVCGGDIITSAARCEKENDDADDSNATRKSVSSEDCYYLPPGMLNIEDEADYPQYSLWHTPLIIERELLSGQSFENVSTEAAHENSDIHFEPYRLWGPSAVTGNENRAPGFYVEDGYSIFSIPYNPNRELQHFEEKTSSSYSLWKSPNIIEFLPSTGCVRLVNGTSPTPMDEDSASTGSLNFVYGEKSLDILDSCDSFSEKLANLKPATNAFVSFTDRGAFKYYRKSTKHSNYGECDVDERRPTVCKKSPFHVCRNCASENSENCAIVESQRSSSLCGEIADEGDNGRVVLGEKCECENESKKLAASGSGACYFKPIQPAFKVETDVPPLLQRSSSGTYYHQNRKLFSFVREAKGELFNYSRNDGNEDVEWNNQEAFKPKFVVRENDKACQTENYNCNSFTMYYASCMNLQNLYRHSSPNQKNISGRDAEDSYSEKQQFFYSLDDVFNFLGQPGFTNIDPTI